MGKIFQKSEKRGIFVTLPSEIWGETEKHGTMMDIQTFTGNDHPGEKTRKILMPTIGAINYQTDYVNFN